MNGEYDYMVISIKDVYDNVVEIRADDFSDMIEQLYQESDVDSPDVEMFIEWIRYGCQSCDEEE